MLNSPKENYTEYGPIGRIINLFNHKRVGKKFNLSLTEFLELPRDYVDMIIESCTKDDMAESKQFNKAKLSIDDAFE